MLLTWFRFCPIQGNFLEDNKRHISRWSDNVSKTSQIWSAWRSGKLSGRW